MHASRLWMLIPALLLVAAPIDADAQGRRRSDRPGRSDRLDRSGPAFCRSGAGHPVHGWEWCREKGWDRADRELGWWERDGDRRSRTSRFPWPF